MNRSNLGLATITLLTAALVACGASDSASTPTPAAKAASPTATASASTPAATATPTAAAAVSTIAVTALEESDSKYAFDPKAITLKAGEVTVKLTNKAGNQRPHTFDVKDASGKEIFRSDRVQPGQSADIKFTLPDAGTFQFLCILQGHADKGQTGVLTVVKG